MLWQHGFCYIQLLFSSSQPADSSKANSLVTRLKGPLVIYGQWELNACLLCVSANFTLIPRVVGPDGSVTPRTPGQHPLWLPGNKAEGTFRGEGWGQSFSMAWRCSSVIIGSRNFWLFLQAMIEFYLYLCIWYLSRLTVDELLQTWLSLICNDTKPISTQLWLGSDCVTCCVIKLNNTVNT